MPGKLVGSLCLPIVLLALALAACAPAGVVRAAKPVIAEPPPVSAYPRVSLVSAEVDAAGCRLQSAPSATLDRATKPATVPAALRGDPDFDPDDLPLSLRCWYEELWSVIRDPVKSDEITRWAASNNLYMYARSLNTHVNALLVAFRLFGDLQLLDEVDRLAQHMRSTLNDAWQGQAALLAGSADGYLNWVWREAPDEFHFGKDVHVTDEMRAHALVAQMAWAFKNNSDLDSPNGIDYAERADFWTSYLRDHFEAKWRGRAGVPWPQMPFISRPHMHEMVDFVRYHHYMYRLTGLEPYRLEAQRLTDVVLDNTRVADSPSGPALVTPRSILSLGGSESYLMPSTYSRYIFSDAVDLYLEGVGRWSDGSVLEQFARTLAEFMIDGKGDVLARDVGGGIERAGVPASNERDWDRVETIQYSNSPFALLSRWESGDKITAASLSVYVNASRRYRGVYIPVAMLLDGAEVLD